MTGHVTTAALRTDLANVMRDAEALMKASAGQGGEKVNEARTRILESLESAKRRLLEAERSAHPPGRRGRGRDRGVREAQPLAVGRHRRRRGARASACCWPADERRMSGEDEPQGPATNLLRSLVRLGGTLLANAQTRVELLTTEVSEDLERGVRILLWGFVAAARGCAWPCCSRASR